MKTIWKNFLVELNRRYQILFEQRDIISISNDYYSNKWISKNELKMLFLHEKANLTAACARSTEDYKYLVEGFNIGVIKNYQERS